jgi:hypothetical protein
MFLLSRSAVLWLICWDVADVFVQKFVCKKMLIWLILDGFFSVYTSGVATFSNEFAFLCNRSSLSATVDKGEHREHVDFFPTQPEEWKLHRGRKSVQVFHIVNHPMRSDFYRFNFALTSFEMNSSNQAALERWVLLQCSVEIIQEISICGNALECSKVWFSGGFSQVAVLWFCLRVTSVEVGKEMRWGFGGNVI